MRLRPWQILTCSICFASNLQSQEVRRALPVTPTPDRLRERSRFFLTKQWANRRFWTRTSRPSKARSLGVPSTIPRRRKVFYRQSRRAGFENQRRSRPGRNPAGARVRDRIRRTPIRPKLSWRLPTGSTSASCTIWQYPNTRSTSANSLPIPVDLPRCTVWQTVTRILARKSPRSTPIAC